MTDVAELSCRACGYRTQCGPAAMLDWLKRVRMVRRDTAPEPDLLAELFRSAAAKFACPDCGAVGMNVRALAEDDDEQWGMGRACEACGKPIGRERLAAVPDARLCIACQGRDDRGQASGPVEYCPRCGTPMVMRSSRSGVTRYVMACPTCRG